MAVPSIFAFFVVSHLLILQYSTGEGNTRQHDCPESFNCGAFGPIKFPFSDATHALCGLSTVNCSKLVPQIDLGWEQMYDVEEFLKDKAVKVRDKRQGNLINSKSCDLFSRWFVPLPTASISFTISPSLTLYKCNYNDSRELSRPAEDYFRGNHSYGVCSGYTIYYTYPHVPIPRANLPRNCDVIELPAVHPNGKQNASDLISLLADEFSIGLNVSNECRDCHLNGGLCPRNTPKFECLKEKGRKSYLKLILATVIPGVVFLLVCLPVLTIRCRKKWNYVSSYLRSSNTCSDPSSNPDLERGSIYFGVPVFSYAELEAATNNFDPSKELGGGGFGTVYHGKLQDGREIAVKSLYEHNYKRVSQFMNEIEILTRLRHRNLVSLYGCTSRLSRELLLVYEYIPNGTVADHLHGDRAKDGSLTWPIRMNIAIETAGALAYLHASDIIHRDVKTNNILLDNNFCVKVADFGLSRLFPTNVTHVSTAPQGLLVMLIQNITNVTNLQIRVMFIALGLCSLSLYPQCRPLTLAGTSMRLICLTWR